MAEINSVYLIKDLAQITGVSVDSVKYYCKIGLIKEEGRSPGTNFRYFGDSAIQSLREIRRLRSLKYSLKQIHGLLHGANRP